jgi:hypothetical protein
MSPAAARLISPVPVRTMEVGAKVSEAAAPDAEPGNTDRRLALDRSAPATKLSEPDGSPVRDTMLSAAMKPSEMVPPIAIDPAARTPTLTTWPAVLYLLKSRFGKASVASFVLLSWSSTPT